jgi:hypothetical protein
MMVDHQDSGQDHEDCHQDHEAENDVADNNSVSDNSDISKFPVWTFRHLEVWKFGRLLDCPQLTFSELDRRSKEK